MSKSIYRYFLVMGVLALAAYAVFRIIGTPGGNGAGAFGASQTMLTPAAELPAAAPDAVGILVSRDDNRLVIGTGNIKFHAIREDDSQPMRFEKGYDGPLVELVITRQTRVYFDVTPVDRNARSGSIQQIVEPGDLQMLDENHLVQAWGEKTGDRLVAQVIVIISPPKI